IVLSYSKADQDATLELKKSLELRGLRVWVDNEIAAGHPCNLLSTNDAIKDACIFVPCLSKAYSETANSLADIRQAIFQRKHMIVVRLEVGIFSSIVEFNTPSDVLLDYSHRSTEQLKKISTYIANEVHRLCSSSSKLMDFDAKPILHQPKCMSTQMMSRFRERFEHPFAIRTLHGKFFTPQPNGELQCYSKNCYSWEHFQVERIGDKVALLSREFQRYVCVQMDKSVVCNRTIAKTWEFFDLIVYDDGRISLKTHRGGFLRTTPKGSFFVDEMPEKFDIVRLGLNNEISLKTNDNKYVSVETGKVGTKTSMSKHRSAREQFRLIPFGLKVAIFSLKKNCYFRVESTGRIICDQKDLDGCELFNLFLDEKERMFFQSIQGKFLSFEKNDLLNLVDHCLDNERFEVVRPNFEHPIALKTFRGTFISVKEDGTLVTNAKSASVSEMFRVEFSVFKVSLLSVKFKKYVSVAQYRRDLVVCNQLTSGIWEKFDLISDDAGKISFGSYLGGFLRVNFDGTLDISEECTTTEKFEIYII
ncbi:hypothetical protein HK096_008206, partial [Nowakowskiella sp. JEL0078]